jgi:hypothetical protein
MQQTYYLSIFAGYWYGKDLFQCTFFLKNSYISSETSSVLFEKYSLKRF